jgi:hypothetical protein
MIPDSTIARSTIGTALLRLLRRAETHHPLDPGAVVPAAIEDHDFAGRREMAEVALDVHLALLTLGRRGERDDAKHARAHALGDRFDRPAFSGAIAPLEDDADLESLVDHPLLQLDQFDVEALQLLRVVLVAKRRGRVLRDRLALRRVLTIRHVRLLEVASQ